MQQKRLQVMQLMIWFKAGPSTSFNYEFLNYCNLSVEIFLKFMKFLKFFQLKNQIRIHSLFTLDQGPVVHVLHILLKNASGMDYLRSSQVSARNAAHHQGSPHRAWIAPVQLCYRRFAAGNTLSYIVFHGDSI
jgi:hypothetical protein